MKTRLITLYNALLLLVAITATKPSAQTVSTHWGSLTFTNNKNIVIEIADTPALRASGLMHRTELGKNLGMFFVYPDQTLQGVWMKNTLLALDVIFISDDGKIVSILENLLPCRHDPCPVYTSTAAAQYMLEVRSGFIAEQNIKIGQEVIIEYHHDNTQH